MALEGLLHRRSPSWIERLSQNPLKTLAVTVYAWRQVAISRSSSALPHGSINVVCISDTHNSQCDIPPGDILIHSGDLTQTGTFDELQRQLDWLNDQPHLHKIVIAGNHDTLLDERWLAKHDQKAQGQSKYLNWGSIKYLEEETVTLRFPGGAALNVYGSPWTSKHGNWAFQYDRDSSFWTDRIPLETDILVTHMPPRNHLDLEGKGDTSLAEEVLRVRPRLHCFGHFHASYGVDYLSHDDFEYDYARIMNGFGGLFALCRMLLQLLLIVFRRADSNLPMTICVNASHVGGLLDEKKREVAQINIPL